VDNLIVKMFLLMLSSITFVTPLTERAPGQKNLKDFCLVRANQLPLHSQFEKMGLKSEGFQKRG
jgi:hypothetical protein